MARINKNRSPAAESRQQAATAANKSYENSFSLSPSVEELADIVSRNCDLEDREEEEGDLRGSYNSLTGEITATQTTTLTGIQLDSPLGSSVDIEGISSLVNINQLTEDARLKAEIMTTIPELDLERQKKLDAIKDSILDSSEIADQIISERVPEARGQGRRELFVLSSLVGPTVEQFTNTNPLTDNNIYVADALRGRMGYYWSTNLNRRSLTFVRKKKNKQLYDVSLKNLQNKMFDRQNPTEIGFFQEDYVVKFARKNFRTSNQISNLRTANQASDRFSSKLLDSFVDGGRFDGSIDGYGKIDFSYLPTINLTDTYQDLIFSIDLPFNKKNFSNISSPINSITAEIKPDYNFFIRDYESLMATTDVNENVLPNLYNMLAQKKAKEPDPAISRVISLDGNIATESIPSSTGDSKGQYYDLFAKTYKKIQDGTVIQDLSNKMKNLVISSKELTLIAESNLEKENFPMNIDLKFKTDKTAKFLTLLKQTDLTDTLIGEIVNSVVLNQNAQQESFVKQITQSYLETVQVDPTNNTNRLDRQITQSENRIWNLERVLERLQEQQELSTLSDTILYLGEQQNKRSATVSEATKFFNSFKIAIFKSKLLSFLENNTRTYKEIISGKTSYNETLLYRIAKYRGRDVTANSSPIQNIFIPNDETLDVINYVDTQVNYEQDYTYVVYAYQFVVGNRYYNKSLEKLNSDEASRLLEIQNKPQLFLVELPYYKESTIVTDAPPSPPSVEMSFYKGEPGKVLLMLNGSVNSFKQAPILIEDGDREKFANTLKSQNVEEGEPVRFGGDDTINEFQVFRIEQHPSAYSDFNGHRIHTLSTELDDLKSNSSSVIDEISPNKKYYYIFRNIDVHNNLSNPSKVIEVEIIKQDGTIFPLVKHVDFKEKEVGIRQRGVKRFVKLQPNIVQSLLDEEKNESAKSAEQIKNNVSLGSGDDRIWGKKIKIRLTSKNTKKVLDFNVKFTHKNVDIVKK